MSRSRSARCACAITRGALHTIPFGSLDTITNYSRDWMIDKTRISIPYDTDLDKVKGIIQQIGKKPQADPELAPRIIETLKTMSQPLWRTAPGPIPRSE